YYFKTKADLAIAAYEEHWREKQPEMDRLFSSQVPPLERLAGWCEYIYRAQKARSEKHGHACGCPYASVGSEMATLEGGLRAKAAELIARGAKYLEGAIADAKREGLANVEDPKAAA